MKRRQHGERLPDAAIQPRRLDLINDDPVRFAQCVESLARHLAKDTNRKARTWEGLTQDDALRKSKLQANGAHFVLEERAERLNEFKLQVVREAAHVVVRLDLLRRLRLL